jgi:DNA recombination protein RmuC
MEWIIALVAFLLGGLLAWFSFSARLTQEEVEKKYILKTIADEQTRQLTLSKEEIVHKDLKIIELNREIAALEQQNLNLDERLHEQREELSNLQKRFQSEFENIANRLLEEKSEKFTVSNHQQIEGLLQPLRKKIEVFEANLQQKFVEETKQRVELRTQVEQLRQLNAQLSLDAQGLVSALRGDNKKQGDWGEFQLELLLEKSGLSRNLHFLTQKSLFDEEAGKQKRPDYIINLPEQKHLVIDAKVSLTAYERFFNASDEVSKQLHLKNHVESLRNHIRQLGAKNYTQLHQINTPEYILLFVPLEAALITALQHDNQLFNEALDRNIVLVSVTTLVATMRTVAFIWRQENQKRNVQEMARQCGFLYDKFVLFVEDLKRIGLQLDNAQNSYKDAFNKLLYSPKQGDTLIGRAERIRHLGAKTTKLLPPDVLPENDLVDEVSKGTVQKDG